MQLENVFSFSKIYLRALFLFIAAIPLILVSNPALAHDNGSQILLSEQELHALIKESNSDLLIIDLRSPQQYNRGHIPSAINIPLHEFHRTINGIKDFVITPLTFQALASEHGIEENHHLVFYTEGKLLDATRAFWVFDFYGHKRISILNGGIEAWTENALKLSNTNRRLTKSNYTVSIQSHRLATKFNIKAASVLANKQIIDARPPEEYQGQVSKSKRYGHIPNAENLPWTSLVANQEKANTLLPKDKIASILNKFYDRERQAILYCNGGKEASVVYFALKSIGLKSSVYDGSWNEWSADMNLPIVKQNVE